MTIRKQQILSPRAAYGVALCLFLALSVGAGEADDPVPPYFTNVTSDVGLTGVQAFRIAVGDLNGDGYADVLVHTAPDHTVGDVLDKQFLYLNEPGDVPEDPYSRTFVDHTTGSGIRDNRAGTTDGRHSDSAIFADVDNDGDLDVFTNVYLHRNYSLALGTNDLLINDGAAHFALSANSTFHTEPNWNTPAATFVDYDNDGNVDLYIGTWYNPDNTMNIDHLYRGGGDGSFANVTTGTGLDAQTTCVYAVAAFDWDDDGDMDLFAPPYSRTVIGSRPRQWRNNGDGTFTQVQNATNYVQYRGLIGQKVSFGTMPRDYDNDGQVDFFEIMTHGDGDGGVGSTGVHSTVVRNDAGVCSWNFADVTGRTTEDPDLTHHGDHFASWLDFDGDMLPDFCLTESGYDNPRLYLFHQQTDHTFVADTVESGLWEINDSGLDPGYCTPVDYDLDGDEDLLIIVGSELRLYRNDVGTQNSWIALKLEGVGTPGYSNKSAIGARVEVTAGSVTQTQEVYAGNGHEGPMRPLTLVFGLGSAVVVDSILVRWPNATSTLQEMTLVDVNQVLTIKEPCDYATDPTNLRILKSGQDALLTWDDPGQEGWTWNVYRDLTADPSGWGAPHAEDTTDHDPGQPGIQHYDTGALASGDSYYYLVTAVNVCGETDLR